MSERRRSVDKKNHSRVGVAERSGVSSIQKNYRRVMGSKKVEVTCVKCRWTKKMTQMGWDIHQRKVHGMNNEIKINEQLL